MYNSKSKNLFSDNILKANKNDNYYYDFGTGKKIEREEVKKERDAFLEGFNGTKTTIKEENDPFVFKEPKSTYEPYKPTKETTYQTSTFSPKRSNSLTRTTEEKKKNTWLPYLGGDLSSDRDKELFLDGFSGRNETPQKVEWDYDEFKHNRDAVRILSDLEARTFSADPKEKRRLYEEAEEVKRLIRGGNKVEYKTDEIFDTMHENVKTFEAAQKQINDAVPSFENPILNKVATTSKNLLFPSALLIEATDGGKWDYKTDEHWQAPTTYTEETENGIIRRYDDKNLDAYDQKNYLKWMYFDGHLIGADKFGNMNMAYVGRKMGLPEWVYKNFTTKDDPEDIFWIDKGTNYAESGR